MIKQELSERGWTQADLSKIMGRNPATVNQIITGKVPINAETAKQLGEAFGRDAAYWLNLETAFRLSLAADPSSAVRRNARLYEIAPVREMEKRGWISHTKSAEELEAQLCKFYIIGSIDEEPPLAPAARASGTISGEEVSALRLAWAYRAFHMAKSTHTTEYVPSKFAELTTHLRRLLPNPEEVRKVPKLLADYGIRLVIVQHLPKSRIDGAAFWMTPTAPVIAMSLRYDRIDGFWHTLMHELSHIKHSEGQGRIHVDEDIAEPGGESQTDDIETRANEEAAEMLVPRARLDSFILRMKPLFYKDRIIQFSNRMGVHPGVVVGQLQHRGELEYRHNRDMLVNVRDHLIGVALTDGWGQALSLN
jgi:HTH-type transcriptional regulator/antitoxin HigA